MSGGQGKDCLLHEDQNGGHSSWSDARQPKEGSDVQVMSARPGDTLETDEPLKFCMKMES